MSKTKGKSSPIVGVVGSGSFGTAIVKMLLENSKKVHWCVRNEFVKGAIELRGHNPNYLTYGINIFEDSAIFVSQNIFRAAYFDII